MDSIEWKARRYDDLMAIAGERAAAKLKAHDQLAAEVESLREKAAAYDALIELGGMDIRDKLAAFETMLAEQAPLQWKARRYDDVSREGGENAIAKLKQYDGLMAELQAIRWKAKRYDDLMKLGGERTVAKLKAYDGLVEEAKSLRWRARRYDTLAEEAGDALFRRVRNYELVAANLRDARRALQRVAVQSPETSKPLDYSVVMVLGGARTGTTLVGSYLAWAPETHGLPREAGPLLTAMENRRRSAKASERFMGEANTHIADVATQTYLRLFLDAYHAQQEAGTLIFRSPALTRYVFELFDLLDFARPKFVCCVRDPRDTVVSLLEWNKKTIARGRAPILHAQDPKAAANFFMTYYNQIIEFGSVAHRASMQFVRYEDATRAPAETVEALATFTGLDLSGFDPTAKWRDNSVDYQAESKENAAVTPLYGEAPTDAQIGRYQDILTEDQVAAVETICGVFMDRFGYERAASRAVA